MSDQQPPEPIPFRAPARATRPRVKKLRLLVILLPFALLAVVSAVFGLMMSVAADVGSLENRQEFRNAQKANSVLTDVHGRTLAVLTSDQNRIILRSSQISQWMRFAIIAIEDQRFETNQGVDVRGVARAFVADIAHRGAAQGGSTITQQFVKNVLQAQARRTIFQKLREAALAYHLTRKWSKDKILTEYLNTIYFGNGAYGIESAARTYFGNDPNHAGCGQTLGRPCARELTPPEAALLAGIVASPAMFDPVTHPAAATRRRNVVLAKMLQQGYIDRAQFDEYSTEAIPPRSQIEPPKEHAATPATPYFTTWVRQQVVDRFGAQRAFQGGLRIKTTLDLDFQRAAESAVAQHLWLGGPSASLVAIDNATGEVRAMVGGRDYNQAPFNVATEGQRQPGSAFKPFVLAEALRQGISPGSLWPSRKRVFTVPGTHGREHFVVNNYEDEYQGMTTLANALTLSDNAVFAAVGIKVGPARVARMATRMGIRTPVSHNLAISLGGLQQGVTPLDMAHAYETIAHQGERVTGTLAAPEDGPVGIREVDLPNGGSERNQRRLVRVLPAPLADEEAALMTSVITHGTGTQAALPGVWAAGKTGTTENYGDAWFVGFTKRYTVAVWVGYPNKLRAMKTEYHGGPVAGGTFPAEIWHDFMMSVLAINRQRAIDWALKHHRPPPAGITTTSSGPSVPAPPGSATPTPAPTTTPVPTPTPKAPTATQPASPAPAPTGGGGGGGGSSSGGGTGGAGPPPSG